MHFNVIIETRVVPSGSRFGAEARVAEGPTWALPYTSYMDTEDGRIPEGWTPERAAYADLCTVLQQTYRKHVFSFMHVKG